MSWYTICYNKQYCGEKAMQSRYMLKLRAKQILVSVKPSPLFAGMMLTAISFLIYIFQYSGSGNTYAELINSGVRDITKLSEALVYDLTGNTGALVLRLVFSLLNTYISFGLVCYSFRLSSGETAVPLQEMFPPHDHHLNSCRHRHAVFHRPRNNPRPLLQPGEIYNARPPGNVRHTVHDSLTKAHARSPRRVFRACAVFYRLESSHLDIRHHRNMDLSLHRDNNGALLPRRQHRNHRLKIIFLTSPRISGTEASKTVIVQSSPESGTTSNAAASDGISMTAS